MSLPSPHRRAIEFIEDIITHSQLAIDFLGNQTDEELEDDLKAQFAILRAIEIVGEAARAVPDDVRQLAPGVPWRDVVAMRNRIAHHYFGVQLDIVTNVVKLDLEPLILELQSLLTKLQANTDE